MKRFCRMPAGVAIGVSMAVWMLPLRAAERVTLRNGFDLICDHQKAMQSEVRLYMTPSDDNYLDVAASDILRREPVSTVQKAHVRQSSETLASGGTSPAPIMKLLDRAGAKHHIDPDLLASVVQAESGGNTHAVSRAGAGGLMQLMPGTAVDLGVANRFIPAQNVAGGTTYLDALLMYYHENLALALAAYNAGPAAVNRYGGIPPYAETRRYVESVIHEYNRRKLREARQRHSASGRRVEMAALPARP